MIQLGYSKQSAPSAMRIVEASAGRIEAVRMGPCDVNWGRRRSDSASLNRDITNAVDKRRMRELFVEHNVPAPHLTVNQEEARQTADDGMRLIGRPDFHTRGRGFWICNDPASVERSSAGVGRKRAATHWIEFIDYRIATKEFRVHVFNGESIRMSMKEHKAFHEYTTRKPPEEFPKRYIRRAAKAAMTAVGLDFGAVDILASEDQLQVWVLEVNAAPGLGGTTPQLWADTFIQHFERREDE